MTCGDALQDMAEEALRLGAEFALFLDDDTQPPPSVILDLMRVLETSDEDVMACGGIYTTKTVPPEPIVYMGPGEGAYWNWKMGDVFPCWAVGNGCLMVRTKIFEKMSKPWFKDLFTYEQVAEHPDVFPEIVGNGPAIVSISPDIFFFTKLAQLGYKVLAHGGVLPIHWGVDGKPYWLPQGIGPTKGVTFDGKPFGWIDDRIEVRV